MEIDVTHMVEERDSMIELSGSRMEHGQDAGRITWNNSVEYGKERPLLADDDAREAARSHFRDYGAWSREEIDGWSEDELQGITCQLVAGDIREMEAKISRNRSALRRFLVYSSIESKVTFRPAKKGRAITEVMLVGNSYLLTVREDNAVRTDTNGMSEQQTYAFSPNPNGAVRHFRQAATGAWYEVSLNPKTKRWNKVNGLGLRIGERGKYYDFSF